VVAHLARDEKLSPPLTGELLIIPTLVGDPSKLPETYAKYRERHFSGEQNKDAPILGRATSLYFMKHYQPDPESHLYRPFVWPTGHAGLPPVSIHVCGMDPLRDDGLIYEEELQAQGVKTKLCLAPGLPHGFTSLYPMLKASEKFTAEVAEGLGWLLKEGKATY
jgi:acetyl esterase/lipase